MDNPIPSLIDRTIGGAVKGCFALLSGMLGFGIHAQTAVVLDPTMIDEQCVIHPITGYFLKTGTLTDGDYRVFLDTAGASPVFDGRIQGGVATGTYHRFEKTMDGKPLAGTAQDVRVVNGLIDGWCSIPLGA